MTERADNVRELISSITSLAELEGFMRMFTHPPPGIPTKKITKDELEELARLKAQWQREGRK